MDSRHPSVLVIMPVGSDPTHVERAYAIKKGLALAGFSATFPSYDAADPRFVFEDFKAELLDASAVLADLTGERPSCYFELGFAEALNRPIRLFALEGTAIHQSGHRANVVFYANLAEFEGLVATAFSRSHPSRPAFSK